MVKPLTNEDRKRLCESITESAEKLRRIADAYEKVRHTALSGSASDSFLLLIQAAGNLPVMHLGELATLLGLVETVEHSAPQVAYDAVRSRRFFHGSF